MKIFVAFAGVLWVLLMLILAKWLFVFVMNLEFDLNWLLAIIGISSAIASAVFVARQTLAFWRKK
jgi:preprotein translocase subunit SecF